MGLFVYKTTNKLNGKYYIGSHQTDDEQDGYLGSGKLLKAAIKKYGVENFQREIVATFDTPEDMYSLEAEIVTEEFVKREDNYNLKIGGFGGWDHINFNKTEKKKICSRAGKNSYIRNRDRVIATIKKAGSQCSSEDRKRWYAENKSFQNYWNGKSHSAKSKEKMSKSKKGKMSGETNHQFGTMWITDGSINRKIKNYDLDSWIAQGWYRGRIRNMYGKRR